MQIINFNNIWISFLSSILLAGCLVQTPISGGMVMLAGTPPATAANPNDVQLFLDTPKFSYSTIALVTASATVYTSSNVAEIEAGVVRKLKEQAATAGANGVIEIVRELRDGATNISGSTWKSVTKQKNVAGNNEMNQIQSHQDNNDSISNSYLLIYRGKAIKSN
ncbi:MAG: hypothetical protein OEV15_01715 [Gallionella sp.]|nr:hypothetical protein [Gallionella sp.]